MYRMLNHDDVDQGAWHFQDPLYGIGGPMTRARTRTRTRKMKEALQGLIMKMKMHDEANILEGSKHTLEELNATPSIIIYFQIKDGVKCSDFEE